MHSSLVSRPNSVIQIIDIPDASENNPQPITKNKEVEFNELITTQKLKEITGISNLFDLYELKIKVNTSDTSIGNIGKMAPNLKMLNLNNSHIQSIRDLGTNLSNLTILWLSQCNLIDLDGIVSIPNIKELYLPYNDVSDISPLGMMEKLEVLDLEGNNIDDISQVEFLSFCVNLTSLTLKGNPIELSPSSKTQDLKDYMYENAVLSRIPQLSILDEAYEKVKKPLFLEEIKNPFTKDFLILQQRLKYLEHSETSDKIENCKPPSSLKRVCFSQSHEKIQKAKNYNKDTTCYRSSEVASQLTNGTPLCGNPVQALRSRIKNTRNIKTDNYLLPQSTCKDNELPIQNGEQLMSDVFEELRLWRSNNCRIWDDVYVDKISSTTSKKNTPRPHTATGFRARQYGFTGLSINSDATSNVLNDSSKDKLSSMSPSLSISQSSSSTTSARSVQQNSSLARSHTAIDHNYKNL